MTKRLLSLVAAFAMLTSSVFAQTAQSSFGNPKTRSNYRVYLCTDPAANTEFTCTVPAGKIWRIVTLRATLTADANVASRVISLTVDDGTNQVFGYTNTNAQTASQARVWTWSPVPQVTGTGVTEVHTNIPHGLLVGPGYRLRSSVAARQVGDDWSAVTVFVEEWDQ